jgi:two-component system, NarL family, sensor histidine kinase DegS
MKRRISWNRWSISTKILVPFLGLTVIAIAVIGFVALDNLKILGNHALETSTQLGESAIQDSTNALNQLGEETIKQIAGDVAKQIEMYLDTRPFMTETQMRDDLELREIVVQPVGKTGYTTLIDSNNFVIIIHKYAEQEKELASLKNMLPSFWTVIESSRGGKAADGYYDWLEVDGSIRKKYASIVPIDAKYPDGLTLWATTYIDEFSQPAEKTKNEINAAIASSSAYINSIMASMQRAFLVIFSTLILIIIGLALILARVITSPIMALKQGAEEVGKGRLDYQLKVKNQDEIGELADSFNKMSSDLKTYMEELKEAADENIANEKKIEENLHLYVQKVSQAQEAERKRIARELHDETAQELVVVLRHLDDLALGKSRLSVQEIREKIRKILKELRRFGQELRPSILDDLGLIPAVKWLASDLSINYSMNVTTEITGRQRQFKSDTELLLFRIIQEALTNVRKHSKATEATIRIDYFEQNARIEISDNGHGFDIPYKSGELTKRGKLGLTGIEERVQLLGGTLNIVSHPGDGTSIVVNIPNI